MEFLLLKEEDGDGLEERQEERERMTMRCQRGGGEMENGDKRCYLCVCVCVEISMSTANSPGLFTRLSEGSDTLARSLFSLFLSVPSTHPADE